jgi:hypothetical protein
MRTQLLRARTVESTEHDVAVEKWRGGCAINSLVLRKNGSILSD